MTSATGVGVDMVMRERIELNFPGKRVELVFGAEKYWRHAGLRWTELSWADCLMKKREAVALGGLKRLRGLKR